MSQCALEVQALSFGAREYECPGHVHEETNYRHQHHPAAQDLRRVLETSVGFDEDPDGDRYQRHPVCEGREDLRPLVPEAPFRGCGPPGEPEGEERERERG